MRQGSIRDTLAVEIKVPRGFAGYWQIIRELDQQGPWAICDILGRTNVTRTEVQDFVMRLRKGGFAEQIGTRQTDNAGTNVNLYKLLKTSRHYPRLRRDGTELPEPINERLWRTIKMAKKFTVSELVELASDEVITVKSSTAKQYLKHLKRAKILNMIASHNRNNQAYYILINNLGASAPKILRCHSVYDPNNNQILGDTQVKEESL